MSVTLISITPVLLLSAKTLLVPLTVHVEQASQVMDACATMLMSVRMGLTGVMRTHNALTLWDLSKAPAILDFLVMLRFVTMLTNFWTVLVAVYASANLVSMVKVSRALIKMSVHRQGIYVIRELLVLIFLDHVSALAIEDILKMAQNEKVSKLY